MLIVIAALALVVVFLANKTDSPGTSTGQSMPDPPQIPATGSDGIPSPAKTLDPIAGTVAGQGVMFANPSLPGQSVLAPPPPMPPSSVIRSSVPVGPPDGAKDLLATNRRIATATSGGGQWRKV